LFFFEYQTCFASGKKTVERYFVSVNTKALICAQVGKNRRINVNFGEVWSGRWESNPYPLRSNLLNILAPLFDSRSRIAD
jgi:hypothetical protein